MAAGSCLPRSCGPAPLKRANKGSGPLKVGIFADGGHRALATDLAKALPSFHKGPLQVDIYATSGGLPTGTSLSTTTYTGFGNQEGFDLPLSQPVSLTHIWK